MEALIYDSDRLRLATMARNLQEVGLNWSAITNLEDIKKRLRKKKYDILILDSSAMKIIERLRKLDNTIPIIMITDKTTKIDHEKLIYIGAEGLITRPYRTEFFLSPISNRDFAVAMLTDGERDYAISLKIGKEGFYDKAVYHFQQAAEKALKSVLICFGIFKKTHFVAEILIKELEARELEGPWKQRLLNIAKLTSEIEPEVTWSRYPGIHEDSLWVPFKEYVQDDAERIQEKCEKTLSTAKEFIQWWFKG